MNTLNQIFILTIFIVASNCQIQDIQKDKLQFFKVQYATFEIIARSFPNLLIWVQNEENTTQYNQTMDLLNNALNLYYHNKIYMKDNLLFVQGSFNNFNAENPSLFQQPGLYVKNREKILNYDLDLTEENLKQLLSDINTRLMKQISLEEFQTKQNDIHENTLILIVSQLDDRNQFLLNLCEEIILDDKYDIKKGLWLNLTTYEEETTPLIKLYLSTRPNINYEGNITNHEEIKRFVLLQTAPTLIRFQESKIPLIFNSMIRTSVHLLIENEETNFLLLNQFEQIAFENRISPIQDIYFFTYSTFEENKQFWSEFKFFNTTSKPKLVITDIQDGSYYLHKYIYTGGDFLEKKIIQNFLDQFREGKAEKFQISEEITTPIILQDNFVSLSQKYFDSFTKEQCLILVYQSSYMDMYYKTKQFALKVLNGVSINLFQIDIQKNEIPELSIQRAPAFVIFKNNKQISVFVGKLEGSDFQQWLNHYQITKKQDL